MAGVFKQLGTCSMMIEGLRQIEKQIDRMLGTKNDQETHYQYIHRLLSAKNWTVLREAKRSTTMIQYNVTGQDHEIIIRFRNNFYEYEIWDVEEEDYKSNVSSGSSSDLEYLLVQIENYMRANGWIH